MRPSSPRAWDEHAKALNEELEDERATELDKELAEGPALEFAEELIEDFVAELALRKRTAELSSSSLRGSNTSP